MLEELGHRKMISGIGEQLSDSTGSDGREEDRAEIAYHSPPALPSPLRLGSWALPAAADAKLDGSGVGIMKRSVVLDGERKGLH